MRLVRVINSLVELLLSRGLATDLEIKEVLLPLYGEALELGEDCVGLLWLDGVVIYLSLQIHHLELGVQKVLAEVEVTMLFDLVDALDHLVPSLLRALLVLPIEVALVRLLRHVADEDFHVLLHLLDDFALRRWRLLLAHGLRVVA